MYGYIYKTTCWLNGCVYIGQKHGYFKDRYLGSGKRLWNAIRKYGKEHFSVELIQYGENQKELDDLEKCCIATAKSILSKDQVFNIAEGGLSGIILKGENNPMYGKRAWNRDKAWPERTRKRISKGLQEHYKSNASILIPWNKNLTKETDKRVAAYGRKGSKVKKGVPNLKARGRKHTEETLKKMRGPRPSVSGENNPMFNRGYLLEGKKNGMYGVHRFGKDNPNYGKFKKDKTCK